MEHLKEIKRMHHEELTQLEAEVKATVGEATKVECLHCSMMTVKQLCLGSLM